MTNKKKIKIFKSTSELVGLTDKEVDDSIDYQIKSEDEGLYPGNTLRLYLNDKDVIDCTCYNTSFWGIDIKFSRNQQDKLDKKIIDYLDKLIDEQDKTHIAISREDLDKIPHSNDIKIEKLYGTKVTQTYMLKDYRIESVTKRPT